MSMCPAFFSSRYIVKIISPLYIKGYSNTVFYNTNIPFSVTVMLI